MNFKAFKMDGLGNDFLIIDNRDQKISLNYDQILKLSNRKNNIGFDQLIYIENSDNADAELKYFNSDGKKADACGNGNRCVADILIKEKKKDKVTFKVGSFLHYGKINPDNLVSVLMPKPTNKLSEIPVSNDVKNNPLKLKVKENLFEGHLLNIGNPHIVFFKKISDSDLTDIGPIIEHHKYFPDRINVTFADIQDKKNIKVNVWERGAGKTLACGTAACATAFVAAQTSKSENPVNIHFQKGHLKKEIQPNKSILMTGPVSEPQKIEVNLNED